MIVSVAVTCCTAKTVCPGTHLDIETVENSLLAYAAAAPVADNNAIKAPLTLEDVTEKLLIVAVELAVIKVIRAHDCPCITLDNSSLESRKIYFIESSVIHNRVRLSSLELLVIHCVVLYTGSNTILLNTFYIRYNHLARKERILTHILEVTAIERSTANIDTRTKKNILLTVACLLSDAAAIKERHLLIPCCSKIHKCRKRSTRVICPASLIPLIPKYLRTDTMRTVCVPYFRNAKTRNTA